MSGALFFGACALIAAAVIALSLVWPAGDAGKGPSERPTASAPANPAEISASSG